MSRAPPPPKGLLLIVIDGWGIAPPGPGNAIHLAQTPVMERLRKTYPSTVLDASGKAVGLPEGQIGNSEVGHVNLGAGRIVDQDIVRITQTIRDRHLGDVAALKELFAYCREGPHPLHVVGLLGPGGVHSHELHLAGILGAAAGAQVPQVWVHHVLDGRDTPPTSAVGFARGAQDEVDRHPNVAVATVCGRYWTMDRDKRWDRVEKAYRLLTRLDGHRSPTAVDGIEAAHRRGETDEFVGPTVVEGAQPVKAGDGVLFYNFRPDRMRQIVRSLADPRFKEFATRPLGLKIVSMTQYDATFEAFGVHVAFSPNRPDLTLGEVYERQGLRQLRIGETEKYAHVTYFFSGGREEPFAGEERILVPSAKVATYDLKPDMGAPEITDRLLRRLGEADPPHLVVLNFANPDMVGHSGRLEPTVEACRVVDACIGRIVEAATPRGYVVAVTADHGNAEVMRDAQGGPFTAHTTNPVPFIIVHPSVIGRRMEGQGRLSDVAPTLLDLVGVLPPAAMTGRRLLAPPNPSR